MACITKRMILLPIVYFVLYVSLVYASDTDTLREGSAITGKATLISAAHKFELGFFTPDGASDKSTYLGIWYYGSNPKIVVWVANRDRPLPNSDASFAIMGANAMVLGPKNVSYWSTNSDSYSSSNYNTIVHLSSTAHRGKQQQQQQPGPAMTPSSAAHRGNRSLRIVKLNDNGELVFTDRGGDPRPTIWRSFDHPTDTFLPGMKLDTNTNLTSWRAPNDPALGNYAFRLGQEGFQFMILHQGSPHYWESGSGTSNDMPTNMIKRLLGSTTGLALDTIRLVVRSNGTIQYLKQQKGTNKWSIMWWQPKDRCSLYNPCGVNGSCNGKNGRLCKCLPGFHPQTPEEWDSGHFSGGCTRKSDNCSDKDPMFLKLPMLRAGNPWDTCVDNEEECRKLCVEECCRAYSYDANGCSRQAVCLIWSNDLLGVEEEYPQGYNLLLRVSPSDIESTSRDCKPCGTYIIPYPLSTSPSCGDLTYSHFHCNTSTGQLEFQAPGGRFRVTAIGPNATKFFIQTRNKNCDIANIQSHVLGLNNSFPFSATKCGDMDGSYLEVEMHWIPAPEPRCNSSRDCHSDWPDTTCKTATDGKNRCLCGGKLNWNSSELNCTSVYSHNEKVVKIGLASAAGVLLIVLLCGVVFIIYVPRRRAAAGSGYYEFREEDGEGIEVPFTNWESIVAATDNFSDANKLGAGGFGPVYKGQLSDGKEIAVKRLSSASGQGIVEFRNEVVLIAKLQHRNLVRLLGYCVWKHEKILLYEYMPNKSLDSFLFDHKLSAILDWEKRFNIILGIARGLLYLHQDSRLRIIHRDLKPNNILLDEELNPKISDFGLARIVAGKDEAANTCTIVGTYGYMSPEYALEGLFSVKSDVYSFGVMVLEIISGKRSTQTIQLEQAVLSLLGYAWRLWNEERAMELMEQEQRERSNRDEVIRCLNVGLLCVQEDPSDRPVMSSVVLMLCNEIMNLSPPKQPAFIERRRGSETTPSSSQLGSSTSCNMITVTSLEGR